MSQIGTLTDRMACHIERSLMALAVVKEVLDTTKAHPSRLSHEEALAPSLDELLADGQLLMELHRARCSEPMPGQSDTECPRTAQQQAEGGEKR